MEFCGRCGTRFGRGIERGRFCPACGHETRGNARYPLYADGTAAVTRRRPASVSQAPTATAVVPPVAVPARRTAPAVETAGPAEVAAVTRRRLATVDPADGPVRTATRATTRATTLATTLATMLVVVLLGLFLLLR